MNDIRFNDNLLLWLNAHMWTEKNESHFSPTKEVGLKCLDRLARSGGITLANLLNSSAGLAPELFRETDFHLGSPRTRPKAKVPADQRERKMCHTFWENQPTFYLQQGAGLSSAVIHSYEVPLVRKRDQFASDGKKIALRKIDLIAVTTKGSPIVIEAKYSTLSNTTAAVSKLFSQFMQGLSYAVTLRYTWSQSPSFRKEWTDSFDSSLTPLQNITKLPVILAANTHHWNKTFSWGDKQTHWKDLCTLVKVAQTAGYPIYLGVISEPVSPDTQWQFQVVAWDSLPTPTTNGPIQFHPEPTS